jgi:hypothetical protein
MAFSPSSPVTGGANSLLTSPTYTIVADTAPNAVSKQYNVSALGGTQTSVTAHSVSSPFTLTAFRPTAFKVLGQPNAAGVIKTFPKNEYSVLIRKGMGVLANQPLQVGYIRVTFGIPAGADVYDKPNLAALYSLAAGVITQLPQALFDLGTTGTL